MNSCRLRLNQFLEPVIVFMNRDRLLIAVLTFCVWMGMNPGIQAQPFERTTRDTISFSSGTVSIENGEGSIRLSTWDRSAIAYEVRLVSEQSAQIVDDARIDVDVFQETLSMTPNFENVEPEWSFGPEIFGYGVSYPEVNVRMRLPAGIPVEVEGHESTVKAVGLQGRLDIETEEGDVVVEKHRGTVQIDADEGAVSLVDARGSLHVDAHEAPVTGDALRGRLRLDLHEGTADLRIDSLDAVGIETEDGPVTLALPDGAGFDLSADLDDDAVLRGDFNLRAFRSGEGEINGPVGGGGPLLHIDAEDAAVTLRSQ